jgi:hypothetical protein
VNRGRSKSPFLLFSPVPILLFAFFALPCPVFGHRLDEYLQATIVAIEPERVRLQINLTPGVAVAEQVLARIDRDHDDTTSTNEASAYAELLKRDLNVQLDARKIELKLSSSYFPAPPELRSGWGFIQVEFSATPDRLAAGPHKLTLENRHLPSVSVYLINAAHPESGSVQITKQIRNENQSTGEIDFTFQPPPNSSKPFGLVAVLLAALIAMIAGPRLARKIQRPREAPSLKESARL